MAIYFKAWLSLERCDPDADTWEDVCGPLSLGTFGTYAEGERFFRALVTAFEPELNDDYAYPLRVHCGCSLKADGSRECLMPDGPTESFICREAAPMA
jgi:hypothetical protein